MHRKKWNEKEKTLERRNVDEHYMNLALRLAEKGKGKVNPNPLVGAVIVKNDTIIATGYHKEYGEPHAEVNAVAKAKETMADQIEGSTIYVTLEPCSHHGKTPPCTDLIIECKIAEVVIGMEDPNALVAGRGIRKLRENGIKVRVGILEEECRKMNDIFIKYITTGLPLVLLKSAMSLDGKIATRTGKSKWISCEASRKQVHELRNRFMGIMVGVGTVIADDPMLDCRLKDGADPVPIIVDSNLRIPLNSKLIERSRSGKSRPVILTTPSCDAQRQTDLEDAGVKVVKVRGKSDRVDLKEGIVKIGKLGIDSVCWKVAAPLPIRLSRRVSSTRSDTISLPNSSGQRSEDTDGGTRDCGNGPGYTDS